MNYFFRSFMYLIRNNFAPDSLPCGKDGKKIELTSEQNFKQFVDGLLPNGITKAEIEIIAQKYEEYESETLAGGKSVRDGFVDEIRSEVIKKIAIDIMSKYNEKRGDFRIKNKSYDADAVLDFNEEGLSNIVDDETLFNGEFAKPAKQFGITAEDVLEEIKKIKEEGIDIVMIREKIKLQIKAGKISEITGSSFNRLDAKQRYEFFKSMTSEQRIELILNTGLRSDLAELIESKIFSGLLSSPELVEKIYHYRNSNLTKEQISMLENAYDDIGIRRISRSHIDSLKGGEFQGYSTEFLIKLSSEEQYEIMKSISQEQRITFLWRLGTISSDLAKLIESKFYLELFIDDRMIDLLYNSFENLTAEQKKALLLKLDNKRISGLLGKYKDVFEIISVECLLGISNTEGMDIIFGGLDKIPVEKILSMFMRLSHNNKIYIVKKFDENNYLVDIDNEQGKKKILEEVKKFISSFSLKEVIKNWNLEKGIGETIFFIMLNDTRYGQHEREIIIELLFSCPDTEKIAKIITKLSKNYPPIVVVNLIEKANIRINAKKVIDILNYGIPYNNIIYSKLINNLNTKEFNDYFDKISKENPINRNKLLGTLTYKGILQKQQKIIVDSIQNPNDKEKEFIFRNLKDKNLQEEYVKGMSLEFIKQIMIKIDYLDNDDSDLILARKIVDSANGKLALEILTFGYNSGLNHNIGLEAQKLLLTIIDPYDSLQILLKYSADNIDDNVKLVLVKRIVDSGRYRLVFDLLESKKYTYLESLELLVSIVPLEDVNRLLNHAIYYYPSEKLELMLAKRIVEARGIVYAYNILESGEIKIGKKALELLASIITPEIATVILKNDRYGIEIKNLILANRIIVSGRKDLAKEVIDANNHFGGVVISHLKKFVGKN